MMNEAHPDQLTFKIQPAEGGSEVPVSSLTQCLTTLVEVDEISEHDLSPFVVTDVEAADWKIRLQKPVKLTPTLSDSGQLLCLAHPAWDLDVFAATRSELFRELKEQLVMLWQEYVSEDEGILSEPAKQLRTRLMQDFEEVPHA